jgi:WD40 repeat protein
MDQSEWFVLLLSEDAAQSVWVDREVAYWLEHKEASRIIPVVTDGQFSWEKGDISPYSTAALPSLFGVYGEEPRWVDLRFARSESQLDLRHAGFRDAVADIASAIRDVPKDELESEEIRQHRRTIRTAWVGAVALLVLLVAATVGAVVAVDQSSEAKDQRVQAERQATVAKEERDRANAERERADQQAAIAEEQALLARVRELVTASQANLGVDPERSILLGLEAVGVAAGAEGSVLLESASALHQPLAASRVVGRIGGSWFVDYSLDGKLMVTGFTGPLGVREDAAIWDTATGERLHYLPSPEGRIADSPWQSEFSADGSSVAIGYVPTWQSQGESGPLVVLWDVASGDMVASFDDPDFDGAQGLSFSPDGSFLVAETRVSSSSITGVIVWDITSGAKRYEITHGEGHFVKGPSLSPDGSLLAVVDGAIEVGAPRRIVLYDAATGTEVSSLEVPEGMDPHRTVFDPSGQQLAAISQIPARLTIWNVEGGTLELSLVLEGEPMGLEWSPSGRLVAVSGNRTPRLIDAATGDTVMTLQGQNTFVWDLAFHPTGDRLAGPGFFADTLIWDIAPAIRREVASLATPYAGFGGMAYTVDGARIMVNAAHPERGATVALLDPDTGVVLAEIPHQHRGDFPVGPRLFPDAGLVGSVNSDGSAALHDTQTLEKVVSLPDGFFALAVSRDGTRVLLNPIDNEGEAVVATVGSWETWATLDQPQFQIPPQYAFFDPTGDRLMADDRLIDVTTGKIVADVAALNVAAGGSGNLFFGRFSPDGKQVVFHTATGGLLLLDVEALEGGADMQQALLWETTAHSSATLWSYFSTDGTLIATMGLDSQLKVWDTATGALVADLGAFVWGHAFHPDGEHLIAGDTEGTIQILTLNIDELIDIAKSRITRSFTANECATYRIDPCPILEDIQSGSA